MQGALSGSVVSVGSLAPLAGVEIRIHRSIGAVSTGAPALLTATDIDGSFLFAAVEAGRWTVVCRAPGGDHLRLDTDVLDDAMCVVDFEVLTADGRMTSSQLLSVTAPRQQGGVRGRVVQANTGHPLPDAAVTIVTGAGSAPDIAPLTDANGRFAMDGLAPGDWTLRALGPAGETGEVIASVTHGSTVEVLIEVRAKPAR